MAATIPFDKRRAAEALRKAIMYRSGGTIQFTVSQSNAIQRWLEEGLQSAYERGIRDAT